jgi:hypothetical protein
MTSRAYWTLYHYVNVLEEFINDKEMFFMLLERYNGLIHDSRFKDHIPIVLWEEIEHSLFVVHVSAICGMDDPVSYLSMFADIKKKLRASFVSVKMMSNRLVSDNASRDVGDMSLLPKDCIHIIISLSN